MKISSSSLASASVNTIVRTSTDTVSGSMEDSQILIELHGMTSEREF